jgi:hypothetical protein
MRFKRESKWANAAIDDRQNGVDTETLTRDRKRNPAIQACCRPKLEERCHPGGRSGLLDAFLYSRRRCIRLLLISASCHNGGRKSLRSDENQCNHRDEHGRENSIAYD